MSLQKSQGNNWRQEVQNYLSATDAMLQGLLAKGFLQIDSESDSYGLLRDEIATLRRRHSLTQQRTTQALVEEIIEEIPSPLASIEAVSEHIADWINGEGQGVVR